MEENSGLWIQAPIYQLFFFAVHATLFLAFIAALYDRSQNVFKTKRLSIIYPLSSHVLVNIWHFCVVKTADLTNYNATCNFAKLTQQHLCCICKLCL